MISRIAMATNRDEDDGFTLIELLVVIIIIGILAAIAIPVFLKQRQKGYDAGIKSDLVNAATAEESYLTDFNTYTDSTTLLGSQEGFKFSSASDYSGGQTLTIISATNQGYCITGKSASGNTWYYDSANGGVQPLGAPASYTCHTTGAA
jgi:type IV pilus assembly protein PilA